MPNRPSPEHAQEVLVLLENGKIPDSVLIELIEKYGNGNSVLAYWQEWLPEHAQTVFDLIRTCYHAKGEIKPQYPHLRQQLYKGLLWHGQQIESPILWLRHRLRLNGTELSPVLSSKDSENKTNTVFPRRVLALDAFLGEFLPQSGFTLEGEPLSLISGFDPWYPARSVLREGFAPLISFPTAEEAQNEITLFLKSRQRDILHALMHWMATLSYYGHHDRVTELSHLLELITQFGNFVWGIEIHNHHIVPIVIVNETPTLPTGASLPPSSHDNACD